MSILKTQHLTVAVDGRKLLDDITMDVWEGHIHAVVGPNGAGKSTFAYTVMGLSGYRGCSGDILFRETSVKELDPDERARLGITLAWQEPARYEGLTVASFIRAAAVDKSEAGVRGVLERMGLDPAAYAGRALDATLSGGERKKIEMASILAMQPALVLLDEPDSGIDVASLENIFNAIADLKAGGTTVVLITHSLTVLDRAEHAFLLCGGRLYDKGKTEKIKYYFEHNCLPCDHQNEPVPAEETMNAGS